MKYKQGDLIGLIPKEELNRKLRQDYCEIDPTFLCFEENYIVIANNVPLDFTIIDCGCYMAPQSYLFQNHKSYIGIDNYDDFPKAPERFITPNSHHLQITLQQFVKDKMNSYNEKVYFICSAVPAFKETDIIFEKAENCAVFYPGKKPKIKGVAKEQIIREYEEIKSKEPDYINEIKR